MTSPAHADHVRQLERLLAQLRADGAGLLEQDAWDRWGSHHASDAERAERAERERALVEHRATTQRELEALVAKLRETAPAAIAAWADAHDTLLADFLARTGAVDPDSSAATAVFVANQEREGWRAVARGERAFVDENTFFVSIDRALYQRLFELDPSGRPVTRPG